ncbi:TetR/AcrR family transcriptional regulator C-terminal domain-containing protein [Companilactobacillus versmoldensis]|uniref:TetR family transcriptional regulator n=1 Tax=Companilactobacillus versmoldensis DSM 14857 = KCTC 3814 TaxID=1423815 RepID=A0A0R1SH77_9LACO|nr:TetR/AcrR family transcriptional regulator C-terminal domain-containing protein [Companilactobacillus versmoldensis]KRL66852.1 TetR family transcriptional regulator [Companilactobacillus versmoldensis DSM 14857 = KCTC 3814]
MMTLKNQTKLLFANQLEQMLINTPMDKIRVVDLCKRCGTIPQTFYYHFHDKYELVAWAFLKDFSSIYIDQDNNYSVESITENLVQMKRHQKFYQQTYTQRSQNSIRDYIQKFNQQTAIEAVESFSGKEITSKQMLQVKYHSYGMMGLFEEWISGKLSLSEKELATFQYEQTPDFLREAYQHYDFRKSIAFN